MPCHPPTYTEGKCPLSMQRTPLLVHGRLPLLLVGDSAILSSLNDVVPSLLPPPLFGLFFVAVAVVLLNGVCLGSARRRRGSRRVTQRNRFLPRECDTLQRRFRQAPLPRPSRQGCRGQEPGREGDARRRRRGTTVVRGARRNEKQQKYSGAGVRR